MAKIANKPISIPQEVKLDLNAERLQVSGAKGVLEITIEVEIGRASCRERV